MKARNELIFRDGNVMETAPINIIRYAFAVSVCLFDITKQQFSAREKKGKMANMGFFAFCTKEREHFALDSRVAPAPDDYLYSCVWTDI